MTGSENELKPRSKWLIGVGITLIMAIIGYLIALLPGFSLIGPLGSAIIVAIAYRQIFGYPYAYNSGITFSSKKLLRVAIILYGLRLNINIILGEGLEFMLKDTIVITFAVLTMLGLAKLFKADFKLSLLLGVGTGVCGAAAIAAVAPIIKAKDEDTGISVGIIALVGMIFSIGYILLRPVLDISNNEYGAWSGMSLHELAHVALAAEPAGNNALAIALLAKLGRVLLLIPLCFIIVYFVRRYQKRSAPGDVQVQFPWFLLGFVLMSLINTYIIGQVIFIPETVISKVYDLSTFLLTMAMVGLGLNVSLKDLRTKAFKPLLAMIIVSVGLSMLAFLMI
ncbi:YeiH family protein [Salinicoccus sp. YB14-2]|uniref:YeiH family protein n=1 Tax=Salinicoccus sp. YB14-2 TaxID=1572701 RepID=UPI00068F5710|nr:putative sulfate exporter family transporter [Salinicoccus sp. YB14-2]